MEQIVASTKFDCATRTGERFVAEVQIFDCGKIDARGQADSMFVVSFEPLFSKRRVCGVDSFQAVCLSIELIRNALRAFRAHGGHVYFNSTMSPINLDSPSFLPIEEPIDSRFRRQMGTNGDTAH